MTCQRWYFYMFPIRFLNSSGALVAFWTPPLRLLSDPEPRTATSSKEERSPSSLRHRQTHQSRPTQHSPYWITAQADTALRRWLSLI